MTRKSTFIQQAKKRIYLKKGMDIPKSLFLFLAASGIQIQATAFAETTDWRLKSAASENITVKLGSTAFQQNTIRGKVVDDNGNALSGVSVTLKGKTTASVTNDDGVFEISAEVGETLVFSSVGHVSKEITISSLSPVNVVLAIANEQLSEVVVVGYGKQKKANLTGAVDQVGSEVFENRPMPNVTQGLQGAIPNLNINLADGKPTRSASYEIRGMGSIGQGGSALILIDGVEGDPAMLNPDDVESVTVLKDAASAAIYGARGTFGVVMITTKSPKKGKTSVNYTTNLISKSATVLPDMVTDAYVYTTMYLEAYSSYYDYSRMPTAFHRSYTFNQNWYDELANRRPGSGKPEVEVDANGNYQYYANMDYYNLLFKNNAWGNEHNLSIQGATDKAGFIVSGRYYTQDGLYRYNSDDYDMYNVRAKGSAKIFKWLEVENNTELSQMNYFNPHRVGDGNVWYGLEGDSNPMIPLFNPDGTLTMGGAFSVGDFWYGKNGMTTKKRLLRNTTSFTSSFYNDLFRIKGDLTFRNADGMSQVRRVPVPYSTKVGQISYIGTETNDLSINNSNTSYLATNIYGEYENTFGDAHYFKGMVGYNYEQSVYNSVLTQRNGLIFPGADNLNLTTGSAIKVNSGYEKWRIAGGFFRLNYAFKERYLVEVNGRYDGSTKFPVSQQWGFFPSISAGWRISNESFWKVNYNAISDLKIRASYGSLGNGNIPSYNYQELFGIAQMTRLINGQLNQKTSQPAVIPDGLTWETSTTSNIGLDLSSLAGRLNFTGDVYVRKTKNMFAVGLDLPAVFGATPPKGNYADMTTRGWELSLGWRDRFDLGHSPFRYNIRVTLADHLSKIDKYTNPEKEMGNYADARINYYEGMTLGEIWGYVTEGFFTSEEDIEKHAKQDLFEPSTTRTWLPGDIKFMDLDGDGRITYGSNKVGDPGDRKILGNSTPRYAYSLNLGAEWKGIFFNVFMQGIGKQDWWPGTDNQLFWGQYNRPYGNVPKSMIGNIWSEDNPDTYFPRYRGYVALQGRRELAVVQTRYMQSVAYIRLKNLQVGYNLPKNLISKAKMNEAKLYLSAENLWSWSPLYKHTKNFDVGNIYGEDIEAEQIDADGGTNTLIGNGGQTYNYPILKSISIGLSVTF